MAKPLAGALVSLHAAIDTAAIAIPTIPIVLTLRILFGVRRQDTRMRTNPDAADYSVSASGSQPARRVRKCRNAFPICDSTVFTEMPSVLAISAYRRPCPRLS